MFYLFVVAVVVYVIAAIVGTGVMLNKRKVRLWGRVLIWATLFLVLLPSTIIFFYLVALMFDGSHYC